MENSNSSMSKLGNLLHTLFNFVFGGGGAVLKRRVQPREEDEGGVFGKTIAKHCLAEPRPLARFAFKCLARCRTPIGCPLVRGVNGGGGREGETHTQKEREGPTPPWRANVTPGTRCDWLRPYNSLALIGRTADRRSSEIQFFFFLIERFAHTWSFFVVLPAGCTRV